jgi:hypothetical protein
MRNFYFLMILLILILAGCSGGGNGLVSPAQNESGSLDSIPVIDAVAYGDSFNAIGMIGAWDLMFSPDGTNAELTAKRMPAIGEDYIVSGLAFFTIAPCPSCLKIVGISIDADGNAVLTYEIKHPFAKGTPGSPPSAVNRLDLDVFDVALVIRPMEATPTTYSLMGTDAYTGFCANPDGFTTELTDVTADGSALPYFLVIDDSDSGTSTNNKFEMGSSATFDASFDLAAGTLTFDLYLTMGYGASAKKASRLTPKYFNPEFNRKPAWKVEVIPPQGDEPAVIGNTWQDNNTDAYDVTVKVWDWQQGATVWSDPLTFADAPENNIYAASNVGQVGVDIPGMNDTLPTETVADGGTGTPADPLIYTVSVPNGNILAAGNYLGLVQVVDERAPLTPTDGRDFLIDTPDGIALNNYSIPEYATYQTFVATVVVGCGPITGQILVPSVCPDDLATGAFVDFEVSAASDNGGDPITLYEVDFDYNGTTFTADDSNVDGIFTGVGPFTNPNCPADPVDPYTYTVAFRGTDSCTPANVTVFATCEVTVTLCCQPVGDVQVTAINRGEGGQDPEKITSITLDWDYISGCAEEFIIQQCKDAWEGETCSWANIATVPWPATDYKYNLSGMDWDQDMRFRVIARETAGDPSSDRLPSEEVFAYFVSHAGYNVSGNNWTNRYENGSFYNTIWSGGSNCDNWPGSSGYASGILGFSGTAILNMWSIGFTPNRIPDLVGQSEAFCDGYWYLYDGFNASAGLCIGTFSNIPSNGGATFTDFNAANTIYNGLYGYNWSNVGGFASEFGDTNQSGWANFTYQWRHVGYYLNDLCDNGQRDYVAHGFAIGSTANTGFLIGWSDAWAFIVN